MFFAYVGIARPLGSARTGSQQEPPEWGRGLLTVFGWAVLACMIQLACLQLDPTEQSINNRNLSISCINTYVLRTLSARSENPLHTPTKVCCTDRGLNGTRPTESDVMGINCSVHILSSRRQWSSSTNCKGILCSVT